MVCLWVVLYGLTYICAEKLSQELPDSIWIIPSAMLLYTLTILLWICRTGRSQMIRFHMPPPLSPEKWFHILPLFFLPGYNLLVSEGLTVYLPAVVLILSTSVVEELFFRGFLLYYLSKNSKNAGIYLTSIFFSILHLVNLTQGIDLAYTSIQVICAFASGLCYSSVTMITNSLFPCIVAHFLTNITASRRFSLSYPETAGMWICVVVCICWGIWQSYLIRKYDKENQS